MNEARAPAAASATAPGQDAWWRLDGAAALRSLDATAAGLTQAQARARLARDGENRLAAPRARPLLREIARRLANPLVLVLLAAGAVSLATGEAASAGIIAAMVLLSVAMDQVQQRRAESAVQRLAETVALRTRVLRDGQ